jgi:hypothetical protein
VGPSALRLRYLVGVAGDDGFDLSKALFRNVIGGPRQFDDGFLASGARRAIPKLPRGEAISPRQGRRSLRIFNGSKWRERIAPVVEDWIARHD